MIDIEYVRGDIMKAIRCILLFVLIVFLNFLVTGCKKEKITLTSNDWKYEETESFYRFNKDGTGAYYLDNGQILNFSYTDNKDSITFKFSDGAEVTIKYVIKGQILEMIDSFGNVTMFYKA